jgi:transcriptional regulator with XRE-family HTH domain
MAVTLGRRLRARRTAHNETLASVAQRAGLSVPYIANLENGRGNPTLSALGRLTAALSARLVIELAEPDTQPPASVEAAEPPPSLIRFAQSTHFHTAVRHLAEATDRPETAVRALLLAAMAQLGSLAPNRRATELDWHRILDTATLIATSRR